MAKKKLLNEAQVRRFMGLAGIKPAYVSNHLQEGGGMMYDAEEDMADEEEPPDLGEPDMEEPPDMEKGAMEADLDPADIQAALEGAQQAIDLVLQPLADAAAVGGRTPPWVVRRQSRRCCPWYCDPGTALEVQQSQQEQRSS